MNINKLTAKEIGRICNERGWSDNPPCRGCALEESRICERITHHVVLWRGISGMDEKDRDKVDRYLALKKMGLRR